MELYFSVALAASTCSRFVCLMITSQSWRKHEGGGGSVYRRGEQVGFNDSKFPFPSVINAFTISLGRASILGAVINGN